MSQHAAHLKIGWSGKKKKHFQTVKSQIQCDVNK